MLVNRNYVLTEYVLNENDCTAKINNNNNNNSNNNNNNNNSNTRRMQALWGEPWTLRFRRWKRSRAFSRRCQRSLATCQAMHGDAVKARPGREKTKMVAAQGSNSSISTLRIRFLPLVVFSVLSCTFSEHYRKKSVDQRPPKSKADFRTPIVDLLCVQEG